MAAKSGEQTDLQWIGARLRALRLERGLTLHAMAEQMGTSHSQVSDTEAARYGVKIPTLLRALRTLGVTPAIFFAGMPIHREVGEGSREEQRRRYRDLEKMASTKAPKKTKKKAPHKS